MEEIDACTLKIDSLLICWQIG